MTVNELVGKLAELNRAYDVVFNMSITYGGKQGHMTMLPQGDNFKVYLEEDPEGGKDFIIAFNEDKKKELAEIHKTTPILLPNEVTEELYVESINNMFSLQPVREIKQNIQFN